MTDSHDSMIPVTISQEKYKVGVLLFYYRKTHGITSK